MNDDEEIRSLLAKILEVQEAHFSAYQQVTKQLIEVQSTAIAQQAKAVRTGRIALAIFLAMLAILGLMLVANLAP